MYVASKEWQAVIGFLPGEVGREWEAFVRVLEFKRGENASCAVDFLFFAEVLLLTREDRASGFDFTLL